MLVYSKKDIAQKQSEAPTDSKIVHQVKLFQSVVQKIDSIVQGFDVAKQSIKTVAAQNKKIKQMLEQLERDMNLLQSKPKK